MSYFFDIFRPKSEFSKKRAPYISIAISIVLGRIIFDELFGQQESHFGQYAESSFIYLFFVALIFFVTTLTINLIYNVFHIGHGKVKSEKVQRKKGRK
jgi:hypothetical protein